MIYAFWGTLAGVVILFAAAALNLINTPEPAGHHHKPRAPREWPWAERVAFRANARIARRQRERDRDEAWLRDVEEIGGDLRMEAVTDGMAAAVGPVPLMPLPPEVREQVPTLAEIREHEAAREAAGTGHLVPVAWFDAQDEPRHDPLAVLGCDEVADAYVGDPGPAELPEPERRDPEMDYRDETGTWPALVDAVMPQDGAR